MSPLFIFSDNFIGKEADSLNSKEKKTEFIKKKIINAYNFQFEEDLSTF